VLLATVLAAVICMFGCESDDPPTGSQDDPTPDTLFEIKIGTVVDSLESESVLIPVTVELAEVDLQAFDLMIVLGHPDLYIRSIVKGEIDDCGWEVLSCDRNECDDCPTRTYRIQRIRDTVGTPNYSDSACIEGLTAPYTLFSVEVELDHYRLDAGDWLPIRFYWSDCSSNTVNVDSLSGNNLAFAGAGDFVHDQPALDSIVPIQDSTVGFPTYTGVQDDCYEQANSTMPPKNVGFVNGGIQLVEPTEPIEPVDPPVTALQIKIEKTRNTFQGEHEYLDVNFAGDYDIHGFNFLFAYDADVLSLIDAIPGDVITQCDWEYFTFRYGREIYCPGGCPSGLVRVLSIADMNDGPNHPDIGCVTSGTLFTLDFLVSDDRTLENMYSPVRFFWLDCHDNTLAYTDLVNEPCYFDQTLSGASRGVYEFEALHDDTLTPYENIANRTVGFPTYLGAQEDCYVGSGDEIWCDSAQEYVPEPGRQPWVDFINGGIETICAGSAGVSGVMNLNNTPTETTSQ
jgi:hypothetical protein